MDYTKIFKNQKKKEGGAKAQKEGGKKEVRIVLERTPSVKKEPEVQPSDSESDGNYETDMDSEMEFMLNTELLRAGVAAQQSPKKGNKRPKNHSSDSEGTSGKPNPKQPKEASVEKQMPEETADDADYAIQRLKQFLKTLPLTKLQKKDAREIVSELETQAGGAKRDIEVLRDTARYLESNNEELKDRLRVLEKEKSFKDQVLELSMKIDTLAKTSQSGGQEAPASKPRSYSDIIKSNKSTNKIAKKTAIKQSKPTAAIYPAKGSKLANSDETKKALEDCINPTKQKIRIRNLRKIGNSGILIETDTKQDLEQVLNNRELLTRVQVGSLPRRKPKIIIFGVPSETSKEAVMESIYKQNLELDSREKLEEEFKLLFKTGKKDREVTNWVAEVSPETRKILLSRNRVFVGFNAHGVKDFIVASRCFKCQSFGHVAKHCNAKIDTCGHCGKDGHSFKDCPNTKEKPTCINCKRLGKQANHSIREQSCPAYKHAMEKCLSRIDFGKHAKT